ncbi:helix-turn-helix transcriptional regulator [Actinoplanes subglobosus]|uniref:LuxR C-terminal-related transcriptional regulator n=1 Tax=Actinoplanes subglobosus TaxID=1547892 RepID=A0ABV8J2C9_9ACTN
MTVVVGVDGSGRTHRLRMIGAAVTGPVCWFAAPPVPTDQLVIVDDAHRLDPSSLKLLAAACRAGTPMVIARRPTIDGPELAELDEAASAGGVELITPLDRDAVARLVATVTGRPVSPEVADAVFTASSGLPVVAVALAPAPGSVPPALLARVQRRFAVLDAVTVTVARVLALRLDLTDHLVAAACAIDVGDLAPVMRALRDEGLLAPATPGAPPSSAPPSSGVPGGGFSGGGVPGGGFSGGGFPGGGFSGSGVPGSRVPGGELMIPAFAEAVLVELPAAERRRIHDAVAGAMTAAGIDPVAAAGQLRAARAATPAAAAVYREAAERLRFSDPTTALGWYDDATDSGGDPSGLAAGRAESSVLLGLPFDVDGSTFGDPAGPAAAPLPDQVARLALVAGAVAAHEGRATRAADLFLTAPAPGPLLAVPFLVGTGRAAEGYALLAGGPVGGAAGGGPVGGATGGESAGRGPAALVRFAEGALAAGEPEQALPLLIEAAEAVERSALQVVPPDTPHAIGAVVAVAAGDVATAEHLLERARVAGIGGPVAEERHRLLLAWARMRAGRYDTALDELRRSVGPGQGRDRLLRAAIAAGIARRRGDIAGLRDAWAGVEPLLARRAVDLWQLEAVEELAVAAARLRRLSRVEPVLDLLDRAVAGLGRPTAWQTALDWIHLQTAVAADDATAATEVAERLSDVAARTGRSGARAVAAQRWAEVLAGVVELEAVVAATEDLHAAELPWEASRLAGQAAIRTTDANAARRLLERARELSEPEAEGPGGGGLSDREVTVARLVLAGSTHREIGAQLYISPKTVEHHVARIRAKLGANTRAELLAMLRELLDA